MSLAFEARANSELFGHSTAERLLRGRAADDRLHHAWLVSGPEGIGKATLAYRFGRSLLAGLPEADLRVRADHPVFRQVAAGSHPDLVTIALGWDQKKGKERKEILLDDTEQLFGLFSLTAANGGWRVVVIDGVDHLNRNAANALLKLLEEPPRQAIFLLTSSAPSRLPTTLRSRCVTLALRPLGDDDMRLALRHGAEDLDEQSLDELVRVGQGSPGKALRSSQRVSQYGSLDELAASEPMGLSDIATLRSNIHRQLRDAVLSRIENRPEPFTRQIADWCFSWSALGRLDEDVGSFHLDKDQLVHDAAQAVRR